MGVIGLWTLLEPAGKPVALESLENKILAIGKKNRLLKIPCRQKFNNFENYFRCVNLVESSSQRLQRQVRQRRDKCPFAGFISQNLQVNVL